MKKIHIFSSGRHTASNGNELEFSDRDLAVSAAVYNPKKHAAPIVIGHPQNNLPAYGWIQNVEFANGKYLAEPERVDANFEETVKDGRFKKVSASFYPPEHPQNPYPGVFYLRHVGFLGAQPPAVKGLKPVEFAAFDFVECEAILTPSKTTVKVKSSDYSDSVDEERLKLHNQALSFMEIHGVDYLEAVNRCHSKTKI